MSDPVAFLRARLDEWESSVRTTMALPVTALTADELAQALRTIKAQRVILVIHANDPMNGCHICAVGIRYVNARPLVDPADWPCSTVRALLAVYRDQPDYDPAWAPVA